MLGVGEGVEEDGGALVEDDNQPWEELQQHLSREAFGRLRK